MDCLLGPWRAASPPGNASGVVDGAPLTSASLLRTPTAGVRSCRNSGAGGARPARPASTSQRPPTRYPADLHGKCFNCLSTAHRVATCKLPPHCFRCKGFQHLAQDCKERRKVPPSKFRQVGALDGRLRHPVRGSISGNRPHAQGGASGVVGAVPGATVGADGGDVANVGADRRGTTPRRQRASPPTTSGSRLGPPK
jgi:hypothetical protein